MNKINQIIIIFLSFNFAQIFSMNNDKNNDQNNKYNANEILKLLQGQDNIVNQFFQNARQRISFLESNIQNINTHISNIPKKQNQVNTTIISAETIPFNNQAIPVITQNINRPTNININELQRLALLQQQQLLPQNLLHLPTTKNNSVTMNPTNLEQPIKSSLISTQNPAAISIQPQNLQSMNQQNQLEKQMEENQEQINNTFIKALEIQNAHTISSMMNHYKIDINQSLTANYETPLMIAIKNLNQDAIKYFLSFNNLNINLFNYSNKNALDFAIDTNNENIIRMVLSKYTGNLSEALKKAASRGQTLGVRLLLEAKANPNGYKKRQGSALTEATEPGHTEIVKLLLDHGANISLDRSTKKTPLILAAQHGHAEILRLILAKYPDAINNISKNKSNALIEAIKKRRTEIIQILLPYAPLELLLRKDKYEKNSIDYAIEKNIDQQTLQLLMMKVNLLIQVNNAKKTSEESESHSNNPEEGEISSDSDNPNKKQKIN